MKISNCSVDLRKVDGTELDIVNAARVSFHKESTELNEKDVRLINYLAKHNHWTPFGLMGTTLEKYAEALIKTFNLERK